MDDIIIKALQTNPGMRLSFEKRWMVWDKDSGQWAVFGKKRHQRTTRTLCSSETLSVAVKMLKRNW